MTDEQMPAVRLSVYWPDAPGHPNSLDVEWAQDNPGSLIGVVQALVGQLLPLMAAPQSATLEFGPATVTVGPCQCGHGHDRHGAPPRVAELISNDEGIPDPNGGPCVVCNDPRLCVSYRPKSGPGSVAPAGAFIAAGSVLRVDLKDGSLVPTTRAETPTSQLAGVAIDAFRAGDIMHCNHPGNRFQLPGWTKERPHE